MDSAHLATEPGLTHRLGMRFWPALVLLLACGRSGPLELQFDVGRYVEVPSDQGLDVSARGLTVSAWMRPDALSLKQTEGSDATDQFVHWLGKGEPGAAEWSFRMYSQPGPRQNRISFYVFQPGVSRGCGSYFQDPLVAGQWIHVAGTVDAAAQQTAIFRNGELRHADSYASLRLAAGVQPLRIGTRDLRSFFQGAIRDLRVWDRPLSASEVRALFGGTAPSAGLVASFPLDEGAGDVVRDLAGGRRGRVVSGVWQPVSTAVSAGTGQSGGGC